MKNINGKKVTIYDIARLSGFSPKTVSRVINGGVNVKEETYQAIQKVIEELSYIPNAYAKNLKAISDKERPTTSTSDNL